MDWGSENLIGSVSERYAEIFRPERRWDVWRSFYNGWIEGRSNMLQTIRNEKPVAYEFHNATTGHCYVDYEERQGMTEKEGYEKTPLFKV